MERRDFRPPSEPERDSETNRDVSPEQQKETPRRPDSESEMAKKHELNRERKANLSDELAAAAAAEEDAAKRDDDAARQKIQEYIQEYLPDYIAEKPGQINKLTDGLMGWRQRRREKQGYAVEGREHLPDGPALFVGNHPEVIGMNEPVFGELADRDVHAVLSQDVHWDGPAIKRWLLKKLGHIPVETTLSQYSDGEKQEIIENQPKNMQPKYQKMAERSRAAGHRGFIRETVATLLSGGDILIYPEGEWTRYPGKETTLRPAQAGFAAIAKEYERVTGEALPIVSFATSEEGMAFGEEFVLDDIPEEMDPAEYTMGRIAAMLPDNMRGVYADAAVKINKQS